MISISNNLLFFLQLTKTQAIVTRRFDGGLGGLAFNEFMILYHLSKENDEKLRRVDLASKIGLTASGITRLLLPMEKIGLIKKEINKQDARVSYVCLASGGKRKLTEALEDAEYLANEFIPASRVKDIESFSSLLSEMNGTIS